MDLKLNEWTLSSLFKKKFKVKKPFLKKPNIPTTVSPNWKIFKYTEIMMNILSIYCVEEFVLCVKKNTLVSTHERCTFDNLMALVPT
jgi:hypothetical protein